MPVDVEGAAPHAAQFKGARLVYLTPGHQFPIGVTMSASRRMEILHLAAKSGTYVFEDDYDSEFRYEGRPLPVLQGLDRNEKVILAGSFNKTMFSSLRLGYMVLPQPLVEPFLRLKALIGTQSVADQIAFCEFLHQGHFERHLRQMRRLYAERYNILSKHVTRELGDFLTLSPIQAGLQTVAWLREGLNAEAIAKAATARNVDVIPMGRYVLHLNVPEGIQLGFAAVNERAIRMGIRALAAVLRAHARSVRS